MKEGAEGSAGEYWPMPGKRLRRFQQKQLTKQMIFYLEPKKPKSGEKILGRAQKRLKSKNGVFWELLSSMRVKMLAAKQGVDR